MLKRTFTVIIAMSICALLLAGCGSSDAKEEKAEDTAAENTDASESSRDDAPADDNTAEGSDTAEVSADADGYPGIPYAQIKIKDYGTVKVRLEPGEAPLTVKNFIELAESGFYDGLTFHRIMDGFMMQGGDPDGNGTGGADTNVPGEFALNGVQNNISHVKGVISMARSQDPDSASSQFFIVQSDSIFLDGQYAGFGYVTEGMDIVDKICSDAKPVDDNGTIIPEEQPVMESVTISYE